MKEKVTLNAREQKRLQVLNGVESGEITAQVAGELLGLSVRQIRRLLAAYREKGAAGLAHGRGAASDSGITLDCAPAAARGGTGKSAQAPSASTSWASEALRPGRNVVTGRWESP